MAIIFGFQLTKKLHETTRSIVYRGIRGSDGCAVVLKVLNSEYPTPRELARYRQEYDLLCSLRSPGVIGAHGLERSKHTTFLVLEDFGGDSLDVLFEAELPSLDRFLELAIQTSAALGHIHQQGVIHKDINPSNLVWNQTTHRLKLIDFGIATRFSKEAPALKNLTLLEGTLPYVSPEQTGRVNRHLDYRTDFYSLGVTFYELLTGHRPFESQDALELVHCHIAVQPRPPIELRPDIPPLLSRIIVKLLAKTAEDRYQSAWGLTADLELCRDQLRAGREHVAVPLGRQDVSNRLWIPQKLYGRAREVEALMQAFENASQGRSELVLVTGYSGIGKSSLVRELYKPITKKNAFFVSGKFDLLQRGEPYSAIATTFSSLVKQLLTGTRTEHLAWQERLLAALGPNGRILTELIPDLELILGPQPEIEALEAAEAKNRLNLAFTSFLRVLCTQEHPLVVFLDDLQWADPATLELLYPLLAEEALDHLLLIGAYRDSEVDATHPLSSFLRELASKQVVVREIHLEPLALDGVTQLLADTLHQPAQSLGSLAELVRHKTQGNPFFIGEFLKMLYEEDLVRFDAALPGWHWDLAEIEAAQVTENVAELLGSKLRKLPEAIQTPLRLAACMGNPIVLDTIALIAGQSVEQTHESLLAGVREGYIHPAAEPEPVVLEGREAQLFIREYRFVHDRVQQAAYGLIPEEQRAAIHFEIGRLLLARLSAAERRERLFELVDHLNLGRSRLGAATERDGLTPIELARLNLAAGQRAKEATAHGAAARYLAIGLELAGTAWNEDYDLALSLHLEAARLGLCLGDFERSEMLIESALSQTRSAIDSARLHQISIVQYTNQGKHTEAFATASTALRMLGQPLPYPDELSAALEQELADIERILDDRPIASLIDEPEMTDALCRATTGILGYLIPTAFQANPDLARFISARLVKLTLEHGQTVDGALGYATYGLILGARSGNYQRAYEFGMLALQLAERLHSTTARCRAGKVVMAYIYPWARPFAEARPLCTGLFEAAMQSGELQYAAFILMDRLLNDFYLGMPLERVLDESTPVLQFSKRNKISVAVSTIEAVRIVAAHLSDSPERAQLSDLPRLEDDTEFIANCRQEFGFYALGVYFALKCQALYLCEEYERALAAAREAELLLGHIQGVISRAAVVFYQSLCLTALFDQALPAQQGEHWQRLEANHEQVQRWAQSCPENFRHQQLLLAAEMARLEGKEFQAVRLYAQALDAAEASGLQADLALANELVARFWLAQGQPRDARHYLRDAHYGYSQWGARRKVAMLEERYAQHLVHPWADGPKLRDATTGSRHTVSTVSTTEHLDLSSVIKASQALSREIALDKLLARLIAVLIENAGAQHGYLLLERKDRLVIEAQGTAGQPSVQVLQALPLEGSAGHQPRISMAIVHYVLRSKETVVLHDAMHEGSFVRDPYVLANQAKSILCLPLLQQGKVDGIIYLENNLSTQVFTPERVELLEILSSQMTISLENSLLYGNLQRASQDLERLLYSIAHDLKEPLRAIQSFSELIMRRHRAQLDNQGRDYLERIACAGQRLGTLLDAIRTISEVRRTERPLQQLPGQLLVQDALARLRPVIEETQAVVRIAADLPLLMVDRRWAAEALYQLIQNSLQYTHSDTKPEIDIVPYAGSEGLGMIIQDRGPGIPEEQADRVFELFRRMVGREMTGTGAGLAIVRQIAVKHGGTAWLCARQGGGTEVYITFGP